MSPALTIIVIIAIFILPIVLGLIGYWTGVCCRLWKYGFKQGMKTPEEVAEEMKIAKARETFNHD